ncbi:MAG: UDP-2,3-diacylglucosamine diphosphatase [Elusimicrobia bacterium]|nr:UDP-2,3-diacylglucosamine diphosphatase [Elusimicrobiota bacterium]
MNTTIDTKEDAATAASTGQPTAEAKSAPRHFRSIWISDVHLGTRNCQAELLLDFFRHHESLYLYLVGDIVDGWQLKKSWFWKQSHNDVIQKILRKARAGTQVFYVPGNHDEFLRHYGTLTLGGITVKNQVVHRTAAGKSFLVLHGDQFDGVIQHAKWLAHIGDAAYDAALVVNRWFNALRKLFGFNYWSVSAYLKGKVKNAVGFISNYEEALARAAHRHKVDGIVCGHIHKAEIREIGDVLYCNSGDWVESCTALVEHFDGRLEIVRWQNLVGKPGRSEAGPPRARRSVRDLLIGASS